MRYRYIAIEREYASGGRGIGEQVAAGLGIPCYGHEILMMAAERKGVSPAQLEPDEESGMNSLMYSLHLLGQLTSGKGELTPRDELMIAESKIILEIAATEQPCVFVGRAAQVVLKGRRDVLSVFIYASAENRRRRAVEEYGISADEALETLKKFDRRRAGYYRMFSEEVWDDRSHYHLMLDSGKLGPEGCVKNIIAAVQ